MADIFISYRRGDGGYAGRLYDSLQKHGFDTFYDADKKSIKPGDSFPENLKLGVAGCKVFLAVIGEKWMSKENLQRLSAEDDWVGYEIRGALERGADVRLVPLRMGDAALPSKVDLPADLHGLGFHSALPMRNEDWESDLEQLVGALNESLTRRSIRQVNDAPDVAEQLRTLCQLCDRVPQVSTLAKILGPAAKPVVILLGHEEADHVGFVESLVHRQSLQSALKLDKRKANLQISPLQWDPSAVANGRYSDALETAIAENVILDAQASGERIRDYLRTSPHPVLMWMQIDYHWYKQCGPGLFAGFVQAWSDLVSADPGSLEWPTMLWLLVLYENDAQRRKLAKEIEASSASLPDLGPIESGHVSTWVKLGEVEPAVKGRVDEIIALVRDKKGLHMKPFVRGVLQLLSAGPPVVEARP